MPQQSTVYANGAQQKYKYNDEMRLDKLEIWDGAGGNLASYEHQYTPGGVITAIPDYSGGKQFTYDQLNQIVTETGSDGHVHQYEYDHNGNRTSETRDGTTTRDYNTPGDDNRLIDYTENGQTTSFAYDPRGNRTTKTISDQPSTINYAYDAENRMISFTSGGTDITYTYDSFGRKVKRERVRYDACDETWYIYDGLDCVYEKEYSGSMYYTRSGSVWILRGLGVAPGVGNIIAITIHSELSQPGQEPQVTDCTDYYHPNHRGDTVFTTDETGEKRAELRYDAFGNTVYESNAGQVKYRFSGKEWDSEAKLYYYGFRWSRRPTGPGCKHTTPTPAHGRQRTRSASSLAI